MKRAQIGDVILDASIRENHNRSGQLSKHPVEQGLDVTNHYRVLPPTLHIEGVVSNTSLFDIESPTASALSVTRALRRGSLTAAQSALAVLDSYFVKAQVITILTGLRTYDNVVLTDLSVDRDADSAGQLHFTAEAEQIRIVSTSRGDAVEVADPIADSGNSSGRQAATEESTETANQSRDSLASQGVDFVQGLF